MKNRIRTFFKLPLRFKIRLAGVYFRSLYYRYLILHREFSSIADRLGRYGYEETAQPEESQKREIGITAGAIRMVCPHTPWKSECLVQAYLASYYLRKKHIPYTVYLGVAREDGGKMIAHAWTRSGDFFVSGGNGKTEFTVTGFWGRGEERNCRQDGI